MNQLQTLLHDSLVATGHVKNCAIIRRKDTTLRASSVGFHPSLDNMHAIANAFINPSGARKDGLKFEDVLYECVRADKFSLYGKHESSGIVVVKTATLFVVGLYSPEMSPSICVEAVEKLADYFREKAK
ncbi:profilin-4-like [Actinia tenebrosa]|uniref:Profilin n=1 Tax=Actinia tenebrosa TaxID=6105 RepID=A0A6P8IIU7_ACTTE|nr:profilin-4-like [Actinia tenebrosa]